MCIIVAVQHYFFWFLEWWAPRDEIELVERHWSHEGFVKVSLHLSLTLAVKQASCFRSAIPKRN
jgi:phosphatidylinositol glycan class A protein